MESPVVIDVSKCFYDPERSVQSIPEICKLKKIQFRKSGNKSGVYYLNPDNYNQFVEKDIKSSYGNAVKIAYT